MLNDDHFVQDMKNYDNKTTSVIDWILQIFSNPPSSSYWGFSEFKTTGKSLNTRVHDSENKSPRSRYANGQ